MSFEHPLWLLALVPVAALAAADLMRRWPASRTRRALAIACRFALLAALVGAAAEPRSQRHRRDTTVVFLIDRSASIGDDALAGAWNKASELRAALHGGEHAAAIQFDAVPDVAIAPGDPWLVPATPRSAGPSRDATDIAAAVRLGLGMIPPDAGGHLVLLGDGRANAGDLASATAAAIARGVPISVVASADVHDDPAVAAVVLDSDRIRTGATLTGHVEVDAGGVSGRGTVAVRVAGVEVATSEVSLDGGHASVPFTYSLPASVAPGVVSVDATLTVAAGTTNKDAGNDRAASQLVVERKPHVVLFDGDDGGGAPLANALRAEQMDVTTVPAAEDGRAPDLSDVDLVILANAPVRAGMSNGVLDDALGEKLVRWVNDGGGLVVLGGPSALDAHYAANRIADALPIEIEPMTPELDSAATVLVILDQSGSMGEMVGGQTKLALAAEGASAVIRLLRSFDHVGVMGVEDRVNWVVPMRVIGNDTAALEARVREMPVGGDGIFIYTSLVAAQETLAKSTTPLRHVILFSDTADAAEQVRGIDYGEFYGWPSGPHTSFAVAKAMKEKGITLSVIGVGDGADNAFNYATYVDDDDDTDFLRELAKQGGGRYYRTNDAKQLRGLFVQDARRLLDSRAHEEDVGLKVVAHHAALDGVDLAKAPKLHGYQEVTPRPAAQVVVVDKDNHPILTRWPYGLGEVAVWASDAGPRWAKDWLAWPGYARFWSQLARSALRRREGDATAIETSVAGPETGDLGSMTRGLAGDSATVRIVRRSETTAAALPHARVVELGKTRELPLRVVEPGVYDARLDLGPGQAPTIELLDDRGEVVNRRTVIRPPSVELRQRGADRAALAALATATGGQVAPPAIAAEGRDVPTTTPLAAWLILFAVLLLPIDASLRRLARERSRAAGAASE